MKKKMYQDPGNIIDLYTETPSGEQSRDMFHAWLTDGDSSEEKDKALYELWKRTKGEMDDRQTVASFNSLMYKAQSHRGRKLTTTILRYTASIAAAVALAAIYLAVRNAPADVNFVEHFVPSGHSERIVLPDGTEVYTNSGTILLYSENYGRDSRTVYMLGEANFKVKKDSHTPFIVKSKDFSVTALGTEFDVSSYPDDPYFKATLISGSIKIRKNESDAEFLLKPAEQIIYNKPTSQYQKIVGVDLYEATAWQRGELIFKGSTMNEILLVLERKFDVTFQYRSSTLNGDKFNFKFKKETTLPEIMSIIMEVADNFTYRAEDDIYYIDRKR
ncbi:MAG: DUF4974 domain-containing protein [Alistipes sp.]|nr:DUF4974 domain-containing protein [Alistipes sp.]